MKENLHTGTSFATGFKGRLAKLMSERGLNNSSLARSIGVSHVTIGNYLAGDFPKGEHLIALADHFELSMDELVGRFERELTTLRDEGEPYRSASAEVKLWRQRAIRAERELAQIKDAMRKLLTTNSNSDELKDWLPEAFPVKGSPYKSASEAALADIKARQGRK